MVWYIMAAVAAPAAAALLIYIFVRDRRYLRKRTSEAMSRELWAEIEAERKEAVQRREKFREAFDRAGKR